MVEVAVSVEVYGQHVGVAVALQRVVVFVTARQLTGNGWTTLA